MSQTVTSTELVEFSEVVDRPPRAKLQVKDSSPPSEDVANVASSHNAVPAEPTEVPSKGTTLIVLFTIVSVTAISTMLAGVVTIVLPTMAHDLDLDANLLLW
jgi:hypothetical protein